MPDSIPVIDLFAGPGGLSEGLSAYRDARGRAPFRIALSIEKDAAAHVTLELRAFFRQFPRADVCSDRLQPVAVRTDGQGVVGKQSNPGEPAGVSRRTECVHANVRWLSPPGSPRTS